jgi:flagellar motor protein MotB
MPVPPMTASMCPPEFEQVQRHSAALTASKIALPTAWRLSMELRSAQALCVAAALLSACASQSHYNLQVEKTATYQQLDAQMKGEIAADQIQIEQLPKLLRLTLASDLLFPEGGWELNDAGKSMLAKVAPALKGLSGQRIVVKGFTDNVPISAELTARFPNNVELSKARAGAIAAFLSAQGVPADIIYTSGLGESHPVASNATPQGRAKNRRVEIDVVAAPA